MNRTGFVVLIAVLSALSLFSAPSPAVLPAHCAQTEKDAASAPPAGAGQGVQQPGAKASNGSAAEAVSAPGEV
jgi:hypothetical protein